MRMSGARLLPLLVECERVKEQLSFQESAELTGYGPETGAVLGDTMTRSQLEDLMKNRVCSRNLTEPSRERANPRQGTRYQKNTSIPFSWSVEAARS